MPADPLVRAILDDRDNPERYLEYAAHLVERGDPRGEFMRVQVQLEDDQLSDDERTALRVRERALLDEHQATWLGGLADKLLHCANAFEKQFLSQRFSFRRGYLYSIIYKLSDAELETTGASPQPQLRVLQLKKGKVTDAGLAHLAGLPALESLWLDETSVTDAGLAHLANVSMSPLQELRLYRTRVTDAGMVHLARLPALRSLALGRTRVTDAGLAHLSKVSSLRELYLPKGISDAGLEHLAGLSGLEYLSATDNRATDAALMHLRRLTALRELYVGGRESQITHEGVSELAQHLPDCEINRAVVDS